MRLIEFFVGFQNILNLMKSNEQNFNYRDLKLGTVQINFFLMDLCKVASKMPSKWWH